MFARLRPAGNEDISDRRLKRQHLTTTEMDKSKVKEILFEIDYFNNFSQNYQNRTYPEIDYGKRVGRLSFNGIFDASDKFVYNGYDRIVDEPRFKTWKKTLNNRYATAEELLCTVIKIFDWGGVLRGNARVAVELYQENKLKPYIHNVRTLLESNEIVAAPKDMDVLWSSGWTKVYSFMNNDVLIYDSRVSAFLNHTLTYDCQYKGEQLSTLKELTKYLFNFEGAIGRERMVDKKAFGFKNTSPSGINGFNANLIISWVVQLINEYLLLDYDIRSYERAFFMLGFDLKQLKKQHP